MGQIIINRVRFQDGAEWAIVRITKDMNTGETIDDKLIINSAPFGYYFN